MTYQKLVKDLVFQFPENALIITNELYKEKLSSEVPEKSFYQAICRLCKNGDIVNISKGVYCRPRRTKYGIILPSENEIVQYYTNNEKGMVIGYRLYNSLRLTTQVPKCAEIYSSVFNGQSKRIGNVIMTNYSLKFTYDVVKTIEMFEILNNYYEIQDINLYELRKVIAKYVKNYNDQVCNEVLSEIRYPKKTIAFMNRVLNYNNCVNSLGNYLSAVSDYNIPKMEEIYEIA